MPISSIVKLIQSLRGDNGCPWDKQQTPRSLTRFLIEEAYELSDAIESGDAEKVKEEAGDVLFQLISIIEIFDEKGSFDLGEVVHDNREKMIRRHPHVFGSEKAETTEQVKQNWKKIKEEENKNETSDSVLSNVPDSLPALMKAYRISERAAQTGFDWEDIQGVMAKVKEELGEFEHEIKNGNPNPLRNFEAEVEFGDILFTLVNVARFAGFHPETALQSSVHKFNKRFRYMEKKAKESGRKIDAVPVKEMHILWEDAKKAMADH